MAKKRDHADIFQQLEETKEQKTEAQEVSTESLKENPKATLEADYREKYSKSKNKSETHIRRTFLIDRELSDRVDELSAGKHGFKTEFFNKAIELLLSYYDEE